MRKNLNILFITAVIFVFSPLINADQISESYFQRFQRNLMDSFIGPMTADGREVTPRQRAMFMGYILNRQIQGAGEFEMDKIRMKDLISEIKEFLQTVSAGEDLWPVVEAGMRGEYKQEVDALLGGSAYVEPIFLTLDDMVRDWRNWDYSTDDFYNYPDHETVLTVVENFLQLMKAKQYQEALKLCAGRCYENFSEWLSEASQSQEESERFNQYFEKLEWKAGLAGMADTDPPMVRIMFALRDPDGDWEEDPCILILDYGVWKIARFID